MNLKKIFVAGLGFLSVFAGAEVDAKMQLRVDAGRSDLFGAATNDATGAYTAQANSVVDDSVLKLNRARLTLTKKSGPYTGKLVLDSKSNGEDVYVKTMTASHKFHDYATVSFGKLDPTAIAEIFSVSPNDTSTAFAKLGGTKYSSSETEVSKLGSYGSGTRAGFMVSGTGDMYEGVKFAYQAMVWESLSGTPLLSASTTTTDITTGAPVLTFDGTGTSYSLAYALRTGFAFANDMGSAALTLAYASVPEALKLDFTGDSVNTNNDTVSGVIASALFDTTSSYNLGLAVASNGIFFDGEFVREDYNYKNTIMNSGANGVDQVTNITAATLAADANGFNDRKVNAGRATIGYVITGQERVAKALKSSGLKVANDELAVEIYGTYSRAKNELGASDVDRTFDIVHADTALIATSGLNNLTFVHEKSDYSIGANAYMGPMTVRANYLMISSDEYASAHATKATVTDGSKTTIRFDLSI